jgi:predicted RNase H-like nuclease (RuvC/YqgF family)
MRRNFVTALAIALLMGVAAHGQSLGDIARENREKKTEDASVASPKVITNKDLPQDPDAGANAAGSKAADQSPVTPRPVDHRSAQQRLAEQRAAENWQRQILAQKNKMAALQDQIDELNTSIHSAGESVQSEGPYNRYQVRELRRMAQMQRQLNEQKMRLDQMQDAARHAGMHTAVYDP